MVTDTDRRKSFTPAEGDLGVSGAFKQSFNGISREVVPVGAGSFAVALPFSVRVVRAEDNLYDFVGGEIPEIIAAPEDTLEEVSDYTYYSNILDDILKNKPELAAEYFSNNPKVLFELIDSHPELLAALAEVTAERQRQEYLNPVDAAANK